MATAAAAPSPAAARVDSTTQRRLRGRPPPDGRSRMAAMMLTRLMRTLVRATVSQAIRKPAAKPLTRLVRLAVKASRWGPPASAKLAKMRAVTSTTARPTPSPRSRPRAAATSAYTVPSRTNPRTSRPRRRPTARSMPSSPLRSSASITNTFTSSMTPAMMAKLPMNRNRAPNSLPMAPAWSSSSRLGVATAVAALLVWGPMAAWSLPLTSSVAAAPPSTPPALETSVRVSGPARPPTAPATLVRVPGATKAPCSANPASPLAGTTLATSRGSGRPYRWKVTRSPARAPSELARVSLSTTRPGPGAGPASDDQAADDDGRAEHRAGHDQGGLGPAAVDLAQGQAAGHGAAHGQHDGEEQAGATEADQERGQVGVHRVSSPPTPEGAARRRSGGRRACARPGRPSHRWPGRG